MTIRVHDTTGGSAVLERVESGASFYLPAAEARQVLESLARIFDFTLVDRDERRGLLELVEEITEHPNDFSTPSAGWTHWQDAAEALAEALTSAVAE